MQQSRLEACRAEKSGAGSKVQGEEEAPELCVAKVLLVLPLGKSCENPL